MKPSAAWRPQNRLLDELPADVCERLQRDLRLVDLPAGRVLFEANAPQSHMYFPRGGIIALLYDLEDGASGAIALVGNEGMVGTALLVDGQSTPTRAVVQVAGSGLALAADAVEREFRRANAFQIVLLRYTQALIAQMAQTAVCNRHHAIEQQLCRWLLLCTERMDGDDLRMTQEAIARMLGVRREGVTAAAGRLQDAGLIRYSRGRIHVVDRAALESRACECYRVVAGEYERLLDRPLPG